MKISISSCLPAVAGLVASFSVAFNAKPAEPNAGLDTSSKGTPKILFETNFFDFGKIMAAETLSGMFKFKNTGDGVLKLEPPQASCDCTQPTLNADTLKPGENGELLFTIKLERALTLPAH